MPPATLPKSTSQIAAESTEAERLPDIDEVIDRLNNVEAATTEPRAFRSKFTTTDLNDLLTKLVARDSEHNRSSLGLPEYDPRRTCGRDHQPTGSIYRYVTVIIGGERCP